MYALAPKYLYRDYFKAIKYLHIWTLRVRVVTLSAGVSGHLLVNYHAKFRHRWHRHHTISDITEAGVKTSLLTRRYAMFKIRFHFFSNFQAVSTVIYVRHYCVQSHSSLVKYPGRK